MISSQQLSSLLRLLLTVIIITIISLTAKSEYASPILHNITIDAIIIIIIIIITKHATWGLTLHVP